MNRSVLFSVVLFSLFPFVAHAQSGCRIDYQKTTNQIVGILNCPATYGYDVYLRNPMNGSVLRRLESSDFGATNRFVVYYSNPSHLAKGVLTIKPRSQ